MGENWHRNTIAMEMKLISERGKKVGGRGEGKEENEEEIRKSEN